MDLKEVGWGGMGGTDLAEERVAGCCECGNEPSGFITCWIFLD